MTLTNVSQVGNLSVCEAIHVRGIRAECRVPPPSAVLCAVLPTPHYPGPIGLQFRVLQETYGRQFRRGRETRAECWETQAERWETAAERGVTRAEHLLRLKSRRLTTAACLGIDPRGSIRGGLVLSRPLVINRMSIVDLKGRVAIVSGASLGIGRAVAEALGAAGADVVVNYRSHADAAEEVVARIESQGGRALKYEADVSDQPAVEKMAAVAIERFGRLDIAVSNAAYSDRESFCDADLKGFRRTIEVTMWGAFYLARAAAQQMIQQNQGGVIVVVSSPHAFIPVPKSMAYNMSKAAIEQMAKTAAIELAEHRIRVNTVQPGWTDTPGERKFASEETLREAGRGIPLGRLATSEEIARGVLFLSDPANEYTTGATLLIDGGISLPWWANRGSAAPA